MNDLVPAFENSLFETPIVDIAAEYAELGIDSFLSNDALKEIPVVKTFIGLGNIAYNMHNRNMLKQTMTFINEFNKGTVDPDKKERYRKKLQSNPRKSEEELGRVLILLGRNIDKMKSVFEAKFFRAYINEIINWNEFCELSDITDRLFISDIASLKEAYENNGVTINAGISYKHGRLTSVGLLENKIHRTGGLTFVDPKYEKNQIYMKITDIGKRFYELAFEQ